MGIRQWHGCRSFVVKIMLTMRIARPPAVGSAADAGERHVTVRGPVVLSEVRRFRVVP
jgi:hypothetical protein